MLRGWELGNLDTFRFEGVFGSEVGMWEVWNLVTSGLGAWELGGWEVGNLGSRSMGCWELGNTQT